MAILLPRCFQGRISVQLHIFSESIRSFIMILNLHVLECLLANVYEVFTAYVFARFKINVYFAILEILAKQQLI